MTKEELLYHYFSGSLTEIQEQEFLELLKNDDDFKTQFEFEKELKRVIKHKKQEKLKIKLQGFEHDLKNQKASSSPNPKLWLIAASIALLFSVGWYFYSASNAISLDKLYASNYEKYPNTIYSITRDTTIDTSIEYKAFEAYETNDFQNAISLFTELKDSKNPEYADFYLAQSYLNNHQLNKAIVHFNDIAIHKKEFSTESLWYLALTYLKANKKKKAIKTLENLIQDGGYKKVEATFLLKKLQ